MPTTVPVAAFVFGAILTLIALLGGGFELFSAKVDGSIPKSIRIAAGVLGGVLMVVGLINPFDRSSTTLPLSSSSQLATTSSVITIGAQSTTLQVATAISSPATALPAPTLTSAPPTLVSTPSPLPTETPMPTPKPPTRTSVPPTESPAPEPTPIPTPTQPANTSPGSILTEGQTWRQDGAELTLKNATLNASQYTAYSHRQGLAFELHFTNRKSQDIPITYSPDNIKATDNRGKSLQVIFYILNVGDTSCQPQTVVVKTDQTVTLTCVGASFLADFDLSNQNITEITISASNISTIQNARWRISVSH